MKCLQKDKTNTEASESYCSLRVETGRAQRRFEQHKASLMNYTIPPQQLFRNNMSVPVLHASSGYNPMVLKIMRLTSFWMFTLCGRRVWMLGTRVF